MLRQSAVHLTRRQPLDVVDAVEDPLLVRPVVAAVVGGIADDGDPRSSSGALDLLCRHEFDGLRSSSPPRRSSLDPQHCDIDRTLRLDPDDLLHAEARFLAALVLPQPVDRGLDRRPVEVLAEREAAVPAARELLARRGGSSPRCPGRPPTRYRPSRADGCGGRFARRLGSPLERRASGLEFRADLLAVRERVRRHHERRVLDQVDRPREALDDRLKAGAEPGVYVPSAMLSIALRARLIGMLPSSDSKPPPGAFAASSSKRPRNSSLTAESENACRKSIPPSHCSGRGSNSPTLPPP